MEENFTLQLDIKSLATELSARYEELNLLYSIGDKLKVGEDLQGTMQHILKEASNIFREDAIILSIPEKGIFEYALGDVISLNDRLLNMVNEIRKVCNSTKDYLIVNSYDAFNGIGFNDKNWFKFVATSIKVKDEYNGILTALKGSRKKDYSTSERNLLTVLAAHLSNIITNHELYQDLKDFLVNLVKSMVSAIEAKDSYTRGHSERVYKISITIARAMGLLQKDVENISWAAILHDVGKMGVPESVLTKPDKLTDNEYSLIMTHPRKGYEILKPIVQLGEALTGVLYHQERYDGRGYPEGLRGDEIPLCARIIAVADTYDAITSSRSYRTGRSHLKAMEEIEKSSGSQLDPEIVEIFRKICNDHPDFIRGEEGPDEDKEV